METEKKEHYIGPGSLIVGYDFSHEKDLGVLIVGTRNSKGGTDVINAFQGKEAEELLDKLVTQKGKK